MFNFWCYSGVLLSLIIIYFQNLLCFKALYQIIVLFLTLLLSHEASCVVCMLANYNHLGAIDFMHIFHITLWSFFILHLFWNILCPYGTLCNEMISILLFFWTSSIV
jgi:hypothetical protein